MTGIVNSLPIRVGVEVGQSNIKTNSLTRLFFLLYAFPIEAKLDIVPVSPTHNAHPLNLLQLIKVQVTSSPQLKASCFKAIGEGDGSPIERELSTCGFVLNRTMCLMLQEAWKTLLSWLTFFTVVVEPSDRTPSSFSRCLSSLRVKFTSEQGIL